MKAFAAILLFASAAGAFNSLVGLPDATLKQVQHLLRGKFNFVVLLLRDFSRHAVLNLFRLSKFPANSPYRLDVFVMCSLKNSLKAFRRKRFFKLNSQQL